MELPIAGPSTSVPFPPQQSQIFHLEWPHLEPSTYPSSNPQTTIENRAQTAEEGIRLPPSGFEWGEDVFHITDPHNKDTMDFISFHNDNPDYYWNSVPMPVQCDTPAQDMEDILEDMGTKDAYEHEYHDTGPITSRALTDEPLTTNGDNRKSPATSVVNKGSSIQASEESQPHPLLSSRPPVIKRARSVQSALSSIRVDLDEKISLDHPIKLFNLRQDKYRYIPPILSLFQDLESKEEDNEEAIDQEPQTDQPSTPQPATKTTGLSLEQQIKCRDDKAGILETSRPANIPCLATAPNLKFWELHSSPTRNVAKVQFKATTGSSARAKTVGHHKSVREPATPSSARSKTSKRGRKPAIKSPVLDLDHEFTEREGCQARFPSKWLTATAYSMTTITSAAQSSEIVKYNNASGSDWAGPSRIVYTPDPIDCLDEPIWNHDKEEETGEKDMVVSTDNNDDRAVEGGEDQKTGLRSHASGMTSNVGVRYSEEELMIIRAYYDPGEPIADSLIQQIQEDLRESGYHRSESSIKMKIRAMPTVRKIPARY